MKKMKFIATAGLASQALSRGLYRDPIQPVAELIINGLDSANNDGRTPVIEVTFWKKSKHPLSKEGPALTVTDNGTGFTDKVIANYVRVAESARIGHGRAGIGKFAPFALTSGDTFHIVSATGQNSRPFMFQLVGANIFQGEGFERQAISRDELPSLPEQGSFSQIIVPDFEESFDQNELIKFLTINLPNTPWTVTVNGVPVPHRVFPISKVFEIPRPNGIEGNVRVELGKSAATTDSDSVWLYDSITKRPVVDLRLVLVGQLDAVLRDPRLVGAIYVPKLEDRTAGTRSGLVANFWKSKMGITLFDILQHIVAQHARELLGEEKEPSTTEQTSLREAAALFQKAFGAPTISSTEEMGNQGPAPSGSSGGGGGGSGRPPKKPSEPSKVRSTGHKAPVIRIEGKDYTVLTFVIPDEKIMPSQVRAGGMMVINMGHPDVLRAKAGGHRASALLRHIMRAMIEAHVQDTYTGPAWQRKLHELLHKITQ